MTSPIDMTAAIALLGFDEISVSRRTRTYNAQGVLVLGAATVIPMTGVSVQTLGASAGQSAGGRAGLASSTGENVDQTPHGNRTYGGIVIFTTQRLYAADPGGQQSDEVTWQGTVYTVVHVDAWPPANYYRVVCSKRDV